MRGAVSSVRISCFSAASLIAAYSRCLSSLAISSAAMVVDCCVADVQDEACSKRLGCLAIGDAVATRIRSLDDQGRHDLMQLLCNAPLLLRQGGGVGDARRCLCLLLRLARLAPLLVGL